MNGGGFLPSDTIMEDAMEGYDSTSSEELVIILPPSPPYISCLRCGRLFRYHAAFLRHVEECLAVEMMKELQKGKAPCYDQMNAPSQIEDQAGPSRAVAPPPPPMEALNLAPPMAALNLFNDPLELRLAPPGPPPPPPQSMSLELNLGSGRNRPGGFQQQPGYYMGGGAFGPGEGSGGNN